MALDMFGFQVAVTMAIVATCCAYLHHIDPPKSPRKLRSIIGILKSLKFSPSDCLQIVVDQNAAADPGQSLDKAISYIVRDFANMEVQNIFKYDVINPTKFAEQRAKMNYFQCNLIFVYPVSSDSLNRLLVQNDSRTYNTRFYPHTKLVVIGVELPQWNAVTAKYIRQNALQVLWLDETTGNMFTVTRTGIALETATDFRGDPSVGSVADSSEKDELRISSFECVPYVVYYHDQVTNRLR